MAVLGAVLGSFAATPAAAGERLCDAAFEDCRTPLIDLIRNETVRIDVSFWFMEDGRYANELIKKWQYDHVPVRIMMDSRANGAYPLNAQLLQQLKDAGIPMREKYTSGILHRKFMLFAGQGQLEFSGANYSPTAFVPIDPYKNYIDEAIYFTDDPSVVDSFKTIMDDMWTSTSGYRDYANITAPLTRVYPTYPIDPELNFPPSPGYAKRALNAYAGETQANGGRIDVQMYRITDRRHADAMIDAYTKRHIPVRLYTDVYEYRNASRLWHAWNVDRMWLAGIPIKVPAHDGINHQKTILLYGQGMTIFGSSNWTSASDDYQAEHNYFTTKPWFFQWFEDQFNRKWNNTNPTGTPESAWFVPLPPDAPDYRSLANGATNVPLTGQKLVWYGGPWAHTYDVYFGTDPNAMTLFAADQALGPSTSSSVTQSYALPALQPGITYYWRIVSKTAALKTKSGPIWSFTTGGTATCSGSGSDVVMWASKVGSGAVHGNWVRVSDGAASGGAALQNTDHRAAKISPALASPANYFETTFDAQAGTPYHLWVRMRATSDSTGNDSIHVQFSDSIDAAGSATMRIGTTSSAEVVLQAGDGAPAPQGYGWADNGWNALGANVYFASSGTHTVRVQQREDGAVVDEIVLSPGNYLCGPPGPRRNDSTILTATESGGGGNQSSLPSPWKDGDIGSTPIAGSASYANGTFTISGSGADIWDTNDAFHYVYQQVTGDVTVQARIDSVEQADRWSKAGVMIRETLDPRSRHALMLVSAAKGTALQWRPSTGGISYNVTGSSSAPPRWVRLVRNGNTITASESANGSSWTTVSTQTISMSATVYVGIAVTSHSTSAATTAVVSNVAVNGAGSSTAGLPAPWADRDVGSVAIAGAAGYTNGVFSITAAGTDIWGTSDQFHFVYQPVSGDVTIQARVDSIQQTDAWSKAGVMVRESLSAGARHALMLTSAGKGTALQWRPSTGGSSYNAAGSSAGPPRWVRLVRSGNTFTASESSNGTSWTTVSTQTIAMGTTVYVGLAVTSHDSSASTTATISNVSVNASGSMTASLPDGWDDRDIGSAPARRATVTARSRSPGRVRTSGAPRTRSTTPTSRSAATSAFARGSPASSRPTSGRRPA
jgi:regulation of enolase protein 1 (concanavalin A-like superfamily)/phosphatidylserine/phosphatidylglycerophosphate/cardiolipin synthase-like enzyme